MNTLDDLIKQYNLKPSSMEQKYGRCGNYVVITNERKYLTYRTLIIAELSAETYNGIVIEVLPIELE